MSPCTYLSDPFFGEAPPLAPEQRRARAVALTLGAVFFCFYCLYMPGEFQPGEDATMAVQALKLGVGPPPGAPLFTLWGSAANHMLGSFSPAVALHAFSAFCGAVAVMLLFGFAREATGGEVQPAAIAAASAGLTPMAWSTSIIATPAAIVWPLLIGQLWMAWRFAVQPAGAWRALLLTGLLSGCLVAVTPLAVVFLPGVALLAATRVEWLWRRPFIWMGATGLFFVGLTSYLFFPLRQLPEVIFGTSVYPGSLRQTLQYIASSGVWEHIAAVSRVFEHSLFHLREGVIVVWCAFVGAGFIIAALGSIPGRRLEGVVYFRLFAFTFALILAMVAFLLGQRGLAGVVLLSMLPPVAVAERRPVTMSLLTFTAILPLVLAPIHPLLWTIGLMPTLALVTPLLSRGLGRLMHYHGWVWRAAVFVLLVAQIYLFGVWLPLRQYGSESQSFLTRYETTEHGTVEPALATRWPAYYPRKEPVDESLTLLEWDLWPRASHLYVAVCDPVLLPLFLIHQTVHGRFPLYWFVENTEENRVVHREMAGRLNSFRGVRHLLSESRSQVSVLAITARGDVPPTPPGTFFDPLTFLHVAGVPVTIWQLRPEAAEEPGLGPDEADPQGRPAATRTEPGYSERRMVLR